MTAETQTVRDLAGQTIVVRVTLDDPAAAGYSLALDHDAETQGRFIAGFLAGVYAQADGQDPVGLGEEVYRAANEEGGADVAQLMVASIKRAMEDEGLRQG